jgi:hypothetical protein
VQTINETAVQVAASPGNPGHRDAPGRGRRAPGAGDQLGLGRINEIAASIDEVSKNSEESADVAQRSVQIAAKGAGVVRQTIQGMDSIRDQIQETSKRIKRLGESSQEIGSIVELINDISEQTNILALNAAIQAASAGEAGRGFAVVADEVQRLAERASNATKRIETLVQTIQSDTNEAVSSMEQTTAEVVAGARLAEDAGLALGEIEKVSTDLANLIQNISRRRAAVGRGDQHHPDDERHPGDHHADLAGREPDRRVDRQPGPARCGPAPFGRRLQAAGLTGSGRRQVTGKASQGSGRREHRPPLQDPGMRLREASISPR